MRSKFFSIGFYWLFPCPGFLCVGPPLSSSRGPRLVDNFHPCVTIFVLRAPGPSPAEGRVAATRHATRWQSRRSAAPHGGEPTALPTLGAGPLFPLRLLRPRQAGVTSSARPSKDSRPTSQLARSLGGRASSLIRLRQTGDTSSTQSGEYRRPASPSTRAPGSLGRHMARRGLRPPVTWSQAALPYAAPLSLAVTHYFSGSGFTLAGLRYCG
ncbi:hypothetical protein NDU88_008505 [Pleurodeles waltl]|uniref:Secreted protein n=1 Tax=Pleurodeles waltl TaxID=8319 RepID=A0AAV7QPX1_PLEWA|nr:hypothetical protein NDU88_008505 [Pleurodeles waltl]